MRRNLNCFSSSSSTAGFVPHQLLTSGEDGVGQGECGADSSDVARHVRHKDSPQDHGTEELVMPGGRFPGATAVDEYREWYRSQFCRLHRRNHYNGDRKLLSTWPYALLLLASEVCSLLNPYLWLHSCGYHAVYSSHQQKLSILVSDSHSHMTRYANYMLR